MTAELFVTGLLRAVGAFYALGGIFVMWGTLTASLAEQATAAIEMKSLPAAAAWRTRWLVASAVLLIACGLSLALLLTLAMPLFAMSAAGQAIYLAVLAPRYFDPVETPDKTGRRSSRNALAVFAIVTALVIAIGSAGWLRNVSEVSQSVLAVAVGLFFLVAAYAVVNLRPLR